MEEQKKRQMVLQAHPLEKKQKSEVMQRAMSQKLNEQSEMQTEDEQIMAASKETSLPASASKEQEKVLITGDDILIEYVDRLMREI